MPCDAGVCGLSGSPQGRAARDGVAAGMLPDRHPQGDFFVCDIFDARPKDDLASMEHPLFSLSTRPDLRILDYRHNGAAITVTPSSIAERKAASDSSFWPLLS